MKKKNDLLKKEIREWLTNEENTPATPEDIRKAEEALIRYASEHAQAPPAPLRERILNKISQLNQQKKNRQSLDIHQLPLLDHSSNWLDWQEAVNGIEPPKGFQNIHLHTLESNEQRELFVVWVREYVEEEVHHDLMESFLILEGSCTCQITDESGHTRYVRMNAGDFITMQLGETHDIHITSARPTKAILQWLKQVG